MKHILASQNKSVCTYYRWIPLTVTHSVYFGGLVVTFLKVVLLSWILHLKRSILFIHLQFLVLCVDSVSF